MSVLDITFVSGFALVMISLLNIATHRISAIFYVVGLLLIVFSMVSVVVR